MFDQCLKILLILGSFNAVARGEDEYTSTSTASNYNECYESDPSCQWQNDPSADQAWSLERRSDDAAKRLNGCTYAGSSRRGNSSIRVISPIFRRVDNYSCLSLERFMHERQNHGLLGLRVYQKPVHISLSDLMAYSDEAKKDYIIFEFWGYQVNRYDIEEFPLKHFDSNFQIIIEGIFGEVFVEFIIMDITIRHRTECEILNRQTTSTTISTTTTMSTTTTERPMGENGDTITDKVMISYTWVDSPPASPQSNLWPTTTWPTTLPTTKQSTTTQTLQEGKARGEAEYTSTTAASDYNECYAGEPNCEWKNDPSADQAWSLVRRSADGAKHLKACWYEGSHWGNSSIRVISPIFRRVDNYSCLSIERYMEERQEQGLLGLRVYQKPVHIALRDLMAYSDEAKKDYIIFEIWGHQGYRWYTEEFPLKHFDSNFQIIVEAIFGEYHVRIYINDLALKQRTECMGNTVYPISRQTTSTTTTMSTTTTERPMRENGDTITDKVKISDTWVDSPPASPQSNLWPTTTRPTTKQPTTTQTLQEENGCDSRNLPIILYLIAPGNSLIDFRVRPPCSASAASGTLTD